MIPQEHLDELGTPTHEGERKSLILIPPLNAITILTDKYITWDYEVINGKWTLVRRRES